MEYLHFGTQFLGVCCKQPEHVAFGYRFARIDWHGILYCYQNRLYSCEFLLSAIYLSGLGPQHMWAVSYKHLTNFFVCCLSSSHARVCIDFRLFQQSEHSDYHLSLPHRKRSILVNGNGSGGGGGGGGGAHADGESIYSNHSHGKPIRLTQLNTQYHCCRIVLLLVVLMLVKWLYMDVVLHPLPIFFHSHLEECRAQWGVSVIAIANVCPSN